MRESSRYPLRTCTPQRAHNNYCWTKESMRELQWPENCLIGKATLHEKRPQLLELFVPEVAMTSLTKHWSSRAMLTVVAVAAVGYRNGTVHLLRLNI